MEGGSSCPALSKQEDQTTDHQRVHGQGNEQASSANFGPECGPPAGEGSCTWGLIRAEIHIQKMRLATCVPAPEKVFRNPFEHSGRPFSRPATGSSVPLSHACSTSSREMSLIQTPSPDEGFRG